MGKGMERDGRWCRTAKGISAGIGHSSSISGRIFQSHGNYSAIPLVKAIFPLSEEKLHIK